MLVRKTNNQNDIRRKSYTIKHKRMSVCVVDDMVASGHNIITACKHANIQRSLFYRWKKLLKKDRQTTTEKKVPGHLRSLHQGRASILAPKENELLMFIFERCEQGIQVTARMVWKFAEKIMPAELHGKTRNAIE